jgi:type IV secretory pathway VirB10-like protein
MKSLSKQITRGFPGFDGEAAFTDAQRAMISTIVADGVTKAIGDLQTGSLKQISDSIAALAAKVQSAPPPPSPPPPPTPDNPALKDLPPAVAEEMRNLRLAQTASDLKASEATAKVAAAEEKAAKSTRKAAVQQALVGINFTSDKAAEVAFDLLDRNAKLLESSGDFVGGATNLPLGTFAKDFFTKEHAYLLKPIGSGGSGNGPGGSGGAGPLADGQAPKIEDIKADMKPEEVARVSAHILSLLKAA